MVQLYRIREKRELQLILPQAVEMFQFKNTELSQIIQPCTIQKYGCTGVKEMKTETTFYLVRIEKKQGRKKLAWVTKQGKKKRERKPAATSLRLKL